MCRVRVGIGHASENIHIRGPQLQHLHSNRRVSRLPLARDASGKVLSKGRSWEWDVMLRFRRRKLENVPSGALCEVRLALSSARQRAGGREDPATINTTSSLSS
jgi:hypothetical protein